MAVYLICTDDNRCKIGLSNNPSRRLRSVQACCPIPLHLEHIIWHEEDERLERFLHKHYTERGKQISGEWFALTKQDIADIKKKWPKGPSPFDYERPVIPEPRPSQPRITPPAFEDTLTPPILSWEQAVTDRHAEQLKGGYAEAWMQS